MDNTSESLLERCFAEYANGTYVWGQGLDGQYERFNTAPEMTQHYLDTYRELFDGLTIYDPCANCGRILDAAEARGFTVKGSDIMPSEHPKVEVKNLFDITDDLSEMAVMTIFRWGDTRGALARCMIEHLRKLNPAVIFTSRAPKEVADHALEGYELVTADVVGADSYIKTCEGSKESFAEYYACLWKRL
ncbi:hypothetical protein KUW19_00875 [Ferrimonas balearica]|uniref:hypothetical protein n=1 Tax=Ferrimonas balearica TaxID=44012 RepID=UPI001C98B08E|nr:hypothetical protein [Ferrimonas balearica]MBY6105030.1 hypothetical protein [Ferrimonas balearica]